MCQFRNSNKNAPFKRGNFVIKDKDKSKENKEERTGNSNNDNYQNKDDNNRNDDIYNVINGDGHINSFVDGSDMECNNHMKIVWNIIILIMIIWNITYV